MNPSPPPRDRPPAFLYVLLAPWIYLFAPARAAAVMIAASSLSFWTMYFLHAVSAAVGVVLWVAWSEMVQRNFIFRIMLMNADPGPRYRTFADVWDEWHADSAFGGAELAMIGIVAALLGGSLLLAWLNVPRVHRDGPYWGSFWRAHRIVAAASGATFFRLVAGAALIAAVQRLERESAWRRSDDLYTWLFPAIAAMPPLLLYWIGRAFDGTPSLPLLAALPPRCEGCGYDLTARPIDERCSECGLPMAESLTPGARRRSSEWVTARRPDVWWRESWAAFAQPARFYARLPFRADDRGAAGAFARCHLGLMAAGAAVWISICYSVDAGSNWDLRQLIAIVSGVSCATLVIAWLVTRLTGAVAASVFIFTRALPDHGWVARAIAYETAFFWTICAYNGILVTSFMLAGEWLSSLLGAHGFLRAFGMMPEVAVLLFGNAVLGAVWLVRYRRILAATRWSNF